MKIAEERGDRGFFPRDISEVYDVLSVDGPFGSRSATICLANSYPAGVGAVSTILIPLLYA